MKHELANIPQRLRKIRKIVHRSKSNCAKLLEIPVDQYENYEAGAELISLPEIELLSAFYNVPISSFYISDPKALPFQPILDKKTKIKFKQLRSKVIVSKLQIEVKKQDISNEVLSSRTDISTDDLRTYMLGEKHIPMEHLLRISEILELPISDFCDKEFIEKRVDIIVSDQQQQQTENSFEKIIKINSEVSPGSLSNAIPQLPIKDQAEIAKLILCKLKAKNG